MTNVVWIEVEWSWEETMPCFMVFWFPDISTGLPSQLALGKHHSLYGVHPLSCCPARFQHAASQSQVRPPCGSAFTLKLGLCFIQIPFRTGTIPFADSKGERGFEKAYNKGF